MGGGFLALLGLKGCPLARATKVIKKPFLGLLKQTKVVPNCIGGHFNKFGLLWSSKFGLVMNGFADNSGYKQRFQKIPKDLCSVWLLPPLLMLWLFFG